jgi:Protein of unknown function (DUF1579)
MKCVRNLAMLLIFTATAALRVHGQEDYPEPQKPGPEHKVLLEFVGKWDLKIDDEGSGTVEYKPIMGGRFVTEQVNIKFGDFPFEWFGIYGYDQNKKKYTAVWVDNMETSTESALGAADGKAIILRGKHIDSRSGKEGEYRWKIARPSADQLTIEMFEVEEDGKEEQVLNAKGTRAK